MNYYIIWNNITHAPHYAFQNGLGPVLYPDPEMAKRKMVTLSGRRGKYFKKEGNKISRSATPREGFSLSYEIREVVLDI